MQMMLAMSNKIKDRAWAVGLTILAGVCLAGVWHYGQIVVRHDAEHRAPFVGGNYTAPAGEMDLRALVEHYARMGGYRVEWKLAVNPRVDADAYNTVGWIARSHDFADALQKSLLLTKEMGMVRMPLPIMVGCFDEATKTVSIENYDSLPRGFDTCAVAPQSWGK